MKVWVIRDLEPLPTDPDNRRLMRAGMLSCALAEAGHSTTWFNSSFDHYHKRQRSAAAQQVMVSTNLDLRILPAPGYRTNVSLSRIVHNRAFARAFRHFAENTKELPDILVTDIPTTEGASAVVNFGIRQNIPTVLSIRDLWPDFFLDFLKPGLRAMARPLLIPLESQARFACANATSLIGISDEYLRWGQSKGGRIDTQLDRVFPLGYSPAPIPSSDQVQARLNGLGLDSAKRLVTFVGSWGVTYDIQLIFATAKLLEDRSDITFVVAGGVADATETAPLGKSANLALPGWLDRDQIAALLSASEIGLLPYKSNAPQGLPNKVFEYMAYGPFQLSTLSGEITSLFQKTGAGRVVANTPEALAGAVVDYLDMQPSLHDRQKRISEFDANYRADKIYINMVRHIEKVADKQYAIADQRDPG